VSYEEGAVTADDSRTKAYLSLGEVLDILKEQFPDVTIGKIRFFEGQGLLVPERTPSGYRKFYPADVERLRGIMSSQQERYVPLTTARSAVSETPTVPSTVSGSPLFNDSDPVDRDSESPYVDANTDLGSNRHPAHRAKPGPATPRTPISSAERPARPAGSQNVAPIRRSERVLPPMSAAAPIPAAAGPAPQVEPVVAPPAPVEDDRVYSRDELLAATGASEALFTDALKQGFLRGRNVMGATEFSADDREMLTALLTFASSGLDPRHVRVFVHAAQREVDLYLQATLPLLRRRPQVGVSVDEPFRRFADLDAAGETLRSVVVRRALRDALDGTPSPR
jgi:DNA-binding transcriptional MerR regulator